MIKKGIDRKQKDLMGPKFEDVLDGQKPSGEKLEHYQEFWQELKPQNSENIQIVARFIVNKCHR